MTEGEISQIAALGRALWVDQTHALGIERDAVAAVSSRGLSGPEAAEQVSLLLLERASREGVRAHLAAVQRPFFRLAPEERVALSALYHLKWSYARLARMLGITEERVAEIAWAARLHLAVQIQSPEPETPGAPRMPRPPIMLGIPRPGPNCPEYHPGRPWPQRFLDEQLGPAERTFLLTHLERCAGCTQALQQVRRIYYQVRPWIPGEQDSRQLSTDPAIQSILEAAQPPLEFRAPGALSALESLLVFFQRRDVQWITTGGVVGLMLLKILLN